MKLHPLTVPYRLFSKLWPAIGTGLLLLPVVLALSVIDPAGWILLLAYLAIAVLGLGPFVAWEVARYRRLDYRISEGTFEMRSGVVSRRRRDLPTERIQNVDVSRSLLQRLIGLAEVRLETAGGDRTEVRLRYVGEGEARRLEQEIRGPGTPGRIETEAPDRAREAPEETGDATESDAGRRADSGTVVFELSWFDLAVLCLLSFNARWLAALAVATVTGAAWLTGESLATLMAALWLLGVPVTAGVAWLANAGATVERFFGFRLTRVGDQLRYERGLFTRRSGTIPLEKIQTVTVRENVLMRRLGYARLSVDTAGYGPGEDPPGGSEAAVPLAPRDRLVAFARSLEPFSGARIAGSIKRPPKRVRRRYAVRFLFGLALLGAGLVAVEARVVDLGGWLFAPLGLLPFVPIAAHLRWRHRGYWAGEDHVVARNGFWRRRTTAVPYYRVQSLTDRRTPFQRRLRLATIGIDTAGSQSFTGSDVTVVDLDAWAAAVLWDAVQRKLREGLVERRRFRSTGRSRGRPVEDWSVDDD